MYNLLKYNLYVPINSMTEYSSESRIRREHDPSNPKCQLGHYHSTTELPDERVRCPYSCIITVMKVRLDDVSTQTQATREEDSLQNAIEILSTVC